MSEPAIRVMPPHPPHADGGLCIEHSPLEKILMVRIGTIVSRIGTMVGVEVTDEPFKDQRAVVRWCSRATGLSEVRSEDGPTKCQALVILAERMEAERSGDRQRPSVYSA